MFSDTYHSYVATVRWILNFEKENKLAPSTVQHSTSLNHQRVCFANCRLPHAHVMLRCDVPRKGSIAQHIYAPKAAHECVLPVKCFVKKSLLTVRNVTSGIQKLVIDHFIFTVLMNPSTPLFKLPRDQSTHSITVSLIFSYDSTSNVIMWHTH